MEIFDENISLPHEGTSRGRDPRTLEGRRAYYVHYSPNDTDKQARHVDVVQVTGRYEMDKETEDKDGTIWKVKNSDGMIFYVRASELKLHHITVTADCSATLEAYVDSREESIDTGPDQPWEISSDPFVQEYINDDDDLEDKGDEA